MWSNAPSSNILQNRLRAFVPPYCPNPDCQFHHPDVKGSFLLHGKKTINRFPYLVYRYRCSGCRRTFSSSYFSLSYRDKKNDVYEKIENLRHMGASKRAIAEFFHFTEDTVRTKIKKLARWSLLKIAQDLDKVQLSEAVAFDGLENFSFSQFDPNNLNHAVGKESYYIYDFNLSPMNRKGRMSPFQTKKKLKLEAKFGKYPVRAIEKDAKKIFERLLQKSEGKLQLHSDNHYAYRDAISKICERKNITHFITPAKVARNFRNRLFPINHTDMLTRHQLADFKRETIAFSKTSVAMLETFAIFAGFKNYRRGRFKKPHILDPSAHLESPAMKLGLAEKILTFKEFFAHRISIRHTSMNEDWIKLFYSLDPHSRRPITAYKGI